MLGPISRASFDKTAAPASSIDLARIFARTVGAAWASQYSAAPTVFANLHHDLNGGFELKCRGVCFSKSATRYEPQQPHEFLFKMGLGLPSSRNFF